MSDIHDITPRHSAMITKRIEDAFEFIRDAIEVPELLEAIPDHSVLWSRDVRVGQVQFRLVAHQMKGETRLWIARVTAPKEYALEALRWIPPVVARPMGGKWGSPATSPETGNTAEAALDALEEKLRDSRHRFETPHRAVGS